MTKRILIPGLLAGVAMLVTGLALSWIYTHMFPQLNDEYKNENLFRSWEDPVMLWFFVHPLVVAVVLAWIWDKVKNLFSDELPGFQKALRFALIYAVFSACGMLITYSTFPVSVMMVTSWMLSVLIEGIIGAWILTAMND